MMFTGTSRMSLVMLVCSLVLPPIVHASVDAPAASIETFAADDAASVTGLDIKSGEVAAAIEKFEAGAGEEALAELSALLKDPSVKSDASRRAEINCGLAIIKIRGGDISGGKKHISNAKNDKNRAIAGRARLILEIGDDAGKKAAAIKKQKGKDKSESEAEDQPPLSTREAWRDAVRTVGDRAMSETTESLDSINTAIDARNWSRIPEEVKRIASRAWDIRAVDIDRESRRAALEDRLSRARGFISKIEGVRTELENKERELRIKAQQYNNPRGSKDPYAAEADNIRTEHLPGCNRTMQLLEDLDRNTR